MFEVLQRCSQPNTTIMNYSNYILTTEPTCFPIYIKYAVDSLFNNCHDLMTITAEDIADALKCLCDEKQIKNAIEELHRDAIK
tara:strand:- start:8 stop:256 length:249 start_codon:yes stop_codon:yes gene_type:complete